MKEDLYRTHYAGIIGFYGKGLGGDAMRIMNGLRMDEGGFVQNPLCRNHSVLWQGVWWGSGMYMQGAGAVTRSC